MDSTAVLTAIFVVLVTIVLFTFLFLRRKSLRKGVLLLGLSDSGKTLLFSKLAYEKFVETYTSIKQNVGDYSTSKSSLQLIDIPGQEKIRGQIFDKYKASALGVVFVVDSSTVQKEVRDVAEYLYTVLSDAVINSIKPEILILCNKQDEALGKSGNSVKTMLEKELNIVRGSKQGQARLSGENKENFIIGDPEKTFEFSQLPLKVSIAESSAIMADEDTGPKLEELQQWLASIS